MTPMPPGAANRLEFHELAEHQQLQRAGRGREPSRWGSCCGPEPQTQTSRTGRLKCGCEADGVSDSESEASITSLSITLHAIDPDGVDIEALSRAAAGPAR